MHRERLNQLLSMTTALSTAQKASRITGKVTATLTIVLCSLLAVSMSGCSVKRYSVNMVGDMLAEGGSVYESDDDITLVGEALPFSIKLLETLIQESPDNQGLLLAASQAYVLYSYAYVQHRAEVEAFDDLQAALAHRERARRLYLRAYHYAIRALEVSYPGIESRMRLDPIGTLEEVDREDPDRAVPMLYWTASSLGLAISVSKHDPALLVRLPQVEALIARAMALDESWDAGSLHEFAIVWAAARRDTVTPETVREHYDRALELSGGKRASIHVAYAEAVSVPSQDRREFVELMEKALAMDLDEDPDHRLVNALAQRRAQWLLSRMDELFLE